jgi:hypothetical protein
MKRLHKSFALICMALPLVVFLLSCQKSSIGASISDPSSYQKSGEMKLKTPF